MRAFVAMGASARLLSIVVAAVALSTTSIAWADDAGTAPTIDAGADAGGDAGAGPDGGGGTDAGVTPVVDLDAGRADGGTALAPPTDHGPGTSAGVDASSAAVIRTLLGLVFLMVLAYVGGHPRITKLEQRLGIAQVMTSGLPYVLLGLLAQQPALDVLNDETMRSLLPLLQFGLGWIGFQTGFSFEARALDRVARGTGTVVVLLSGFPFVVIAGASALLLWAVGLGPDPIALARDACLLGLAGALSAPSLERVLGERTSHEALELARAIAVLDDVLGVLALTFLAAFLHSGANAHHWQLPGVGWVFVTFGMAVSIGLVVYFVLRGTDSGGEKTSLLLGSVALTAGLAGYLSLSPLVICFYAGILLRNLPGEDKVELESALRRLERPIYLLFLVIVGALWRIQDWRGWVLLPVFVIARFVGRYAGARTARSLPVDERPVALDVTDDRELVAPPMGQLALAFVVTAQTLYESPAVQAVVTAVMGGAVLLEVVVQISSRRARKPVTSTPSTEVALPVSETAVTVVASASDATAGAATEEPARTAPSSEEGTST